MKENTTYRDAFLANLQRNLTRTLAITNQLSNYESDIKAAEVVKMVEKNVNGRLTKKSAAWFYTKLQAEIARRMPGVTISHDLAKDIVTSSRNDAMGKAEDNTTKAMMLGAEYLRLIGSLKSSISKTLDDARSMMQFYFEESEGGDCTVTGYACDGYRIVKTYGSCSLQGGSFTAQVRAPRVKPGRYDLVIFTPEKEAVTVSFGEVSFRYPEPREKVDFRELYRRLDEKFTEQASVWLNPEYLKEMAASMDAGRTQLARSRREPVKVTLQGSVQAVKMQCDKVTGFVLPVREPGSSTRESDKSQEA